MPNKPKNYNFAWQLRVFTFICTICTSSPRLSVCAGFLSYPALGSADFQLRSWPANLELVIFPPRHLRLEPGIAQREPVTPEWMCHLHATCFWRYIYGTNMHDIIYIIIDYRLFKTITNTLRNWRGLCKTGQDLTFWQNIGTPNTIINEYWWYKQLCLRLLW